MLASADASGNTISYSYDASGRISGVSGASGQSTYYDYDASGRLDATAQRLQRRGRRQRQRHTRALPIRHTGATGASHARPKP